MAHKANNSADPRKVDYSEISRVLCALGQDRAAIEPRRFQRREVAAVGNDEQFSTGHVRRHVVGLRGTPYQGAPTADDQRRTPDRGEPRTDIAPPVEAALPYSTVRRSTASAPRFLRASRTSGWSG